MLSGDTRKQLAIAFGLAFASVLGAEIGKWGVELAKRALRVEPPPAKDER